jgi:hypothetical protein
MEVSQALYQVTWDEIDAALWKFYLEKILGSSTKHVLESNALISFPWVLPDILGKIAVSFVETELQGPILKR